MTYSVQYENNAERILKECNMKFWCDSLVCLSQMIMNLVLSGLSFNLTPEQKKKDSVSSVILFQR